MRLMHSLLAATALLTLPLSVRADIVKFNVVGGLYSGVSTLGVAQTGTITGTVSIDTTTYLVSATQLKFSSASGTANLATNNDENADTVHAGYTSFDDTRTAQYGPLANHLDFAIASGLYTGGAICSTSSLCTGGAYSTFTVQDTSVTFSCGFQPLCPNPIIGASALNGTYSISAGSLVDPNAVAATPEPSSLILLGTGVLTLAGATRRRFLKA